ncbi:hypothetical protein ISS07_00100 [Candidatus Woesearchaeota archaeon]|nr:hypothetical protein [Candidatus Woesearchaeota archaeon]
MQKRGVGDHILSLLVIVLVILMVLVFKFWFTNNVFLVSLEINHDSLTINQDEELLFTLNIVPDKPGEVTIEYEIANLETEEVVWTKILKTKVQSSGTNFRENFVVSSLYRGDYNLNVKVSSETKKRSASSFFKVESLERKFEEAQRKGSIEIEEKNVYEIGEPAKENINGAESICTAQGSGSDCFSDLAQETGDESFCERISDSIIKDDCITNLALQGNYDLCSEIKDNYQREVCFALKR